MTFHGWIEFKGLRQVWVAKRLGITRQYLCNLLRYLRDGDGDVQGISNELKAKIIDFTKGWVTLEELTWPHGRKRYPAFDDPEQEGTPS